MMHDESRIPAPLGRGVVKQDELGNAAYAVPMVDIHDGWTQRPQIQEQPRSVTYNDSQKLAIGCPDPVTVVEAAAGSGKTRMLIGRILYGSRCDHPL